MDKRKHPRAAFRCSVTVWRNGETTRLNAYTKNLSLEGVCVVLQDELAINEEVRLQIDLGDSLPPLTSQAKVVWTLAYRLDEPPIQSTTRYQTGFHFTDLSGTDRARIEKMVSQRA